MSNDDLAFWAVMQKARTEAQEGKPMMLTMEDGAKVAVSTQAGCAGAVMATAFDSEPAVFLRQEGQRSKIPANAMLEAATRDEFRWLAAFGAYFLASERSLIQQQTSDGMGQAFLVGKILTVVLPGAGSLLSAVEAQAHRAIMVDGLVGGADLFANEVVLLLGGDPAAGLRLSERLKSKGIRADILVMDEFRRSNAEQHVKRLREIETQRDAADLAASNDKGAQRPLEQPNRR